MVALEGGKFLISEVRSTSVTFRLADHSSFDIRFLGNRWYLKKRQTFYLEPRARIWPCSLPTGPHDPNDAPRSSQKHHSVRFGGRAAVDIRALGGFVTCCLSPLHQQAAHLPMRKGSWREGHSLLFFLTHTLSLSLIHTRSLSLTHTLACSFSPPPPSFYHPAAHPAVCLT